MTRVTHAWYLLHVNPATVCLFAHCISVWGPAYVPATSSGVRWVDGKRVEESAPGRAVVETGRRGRAVRPAHRVRYWLKLRSDDCGYTKLCAYEDREVTRERYDHYHVGDQFAEY